MSNLSSMEYVERSVQTDQGQGGSRKSSIESKVSSEPVHQVRLRSSPDTFQEKTPTIFEKEKTPTIFEKEKTPTIFEKEFKANTFLNKNIGPGDRVRHSVPRISKKWNQSINEGLHNNDRFQPMDYNIRFSKPTPAESLPLLSAPPNMEGKKKLFSFSPEVESFKPPITQKSSEEASDSSGSKSEESMIDTLTLRQEIKEAHNKFTEEEGSLDDSENESRRASSPMRIAQATKNRFTSVESLPQGISSDSSPGEQSISGRDIPQKTGRRIHPTKFLKRAQSFSQAFRRITEPTKKKRPGEGGGVPPIRDDYRIMTREPQGEMALIPLDKLISIEDVQMQMSLPETIREN